MPSNIEVLQRLFRAVEERDLPTLLDCYDADVEINESPSLPYGGVYRGHDGVRRHAAGFMRAWGAYQTATMVAMEPRFADVDAETVVAVFRHRATDADARRLDTPEIGLYEFRRGKVCRTQMFHFDPAELVRFIDGGQGG
jgi:ketosteroid isomerase-like protein